MKSNYSSVKSALLYARRGCSKIFSNRWSVLLLLFIFAAGCKKVIEETGIVGVCPVVVSTDPTNNAVDVATNKVIAATFNTDMNPANINAASFSIKQGTQIISGTTAPTANGSVFTFTPDVPLLPFTKYTGTITTAATDKFRTAMVADYVWTFTTIPQVTLSASPAAGGTVTGAGTFAQGATVTVNATPKAGYTLPTGTDSGSTTSVSTSPAYQYKMAGNRALVANFT